MRTVNVETFINQNYSGISAPSLVLADDGETYVLKKQRTDNGNLDCMFLNEVFSYKIAKYLGVPTPESVIANLDKDLTDIDRDIIFVHKFFPGMHFASKEIKNIENNLYENMSELIQMQKPYIKRTWNEFFKQISNKKDIAKIICFDLLIANFDRNNHPENFLVAEDKNRYILYAIDQGHSFFGPCWNQSKMESLDGYNRVSNYLDQYFIKHLQELRGTANFGVIFKALETNVDLVDLSNHDFIDIVEKIENLNESILKNMFKNIPDEWFVNKHVQIDYYVNFIMLHKNNIRHLIQHLAYNNYFTNYKGGRLEWKNQVLKDATL